MYIQQCLLTLHILLQINHLRFETTAVAQSVIVRSTIPSTYEEFLVM